MVVVQCNGYHRISCWGGGRQMVPLVKDGHASDWLCTPSSSSCCFYVPYITKVVMKCVCAIGSHAAAACSLYLNTDLKKGNAELAL